MIEKVSNSKEPQFFTQSDLLYLSKWANKVYDKNNSEHIVAKNYLMKTIWVKTEYWASQLVKKFTEFKISCPYVWMERGWDDSSGKNKQVVRFKAYTWAKVYKKCDENRDIFFTFGISSNYKALIYKLDYHFNKGSKLSFNQKELCKQLIPEELTRILIPFDLIVKYNWSKLFKDTETFIHNNTRVYDEIIQSVWSGKIKVFKLKNRLIKRENNYEGLTEIPPRKFKFQGSEVYFGE